MVQLYYKRTKLLLDNLIINYNIINHITEYKIKKL